MTRARPCCPRRSSGRTGSVDGGPFGGGGPATRSSWAGVALLLGFLPSSCGGEPAGFRVVEVRLVGARSGAAREVREEPRPAEEVEGPASSDLEEGEGEVAGEGSWVVLDYEIYDEAGALLESTLEAGAPVELEVGARRVYPAVSFGVVGMRPGGVRHVEVPPGAFTPPPGMTSRLPFDRRMTFVLHLRAVRPRR